MGNISYISSYIYFIIGLVFLIQILNSNNKTKKKCGQLCFIIIYIFAICRYQIGYDYYSYWDMIVSSNPPRDDMEFLSRKIVDFVRLLKFPPLLFFIFSSISLFAYKKVVDEYSSLPALSWYFYFSYPMLFVQDCSTIRQSGAMGLFFLTYFYLEKKKIKIALICILLASLFHNSGMASISLLFLPLIKRVNLKYNVLALVLSFFTGEVLLRFISQYLSGYAVADRFLYYVNQEMNNFVLFQYIMYAINIFNLLFWNKLSLINKLNPLYVTLVNVGLCLYNVFQFEPTTAIRLANFFILFELLLLPSYIVVLRGYFPSLKTVKYSIFIPLFLLQIMMVFTYIKGYNNRTIDRGTYVPYQTWFFQRW